MADGGDEIVDDRQCPPVPVEQGRADDPPISVEEHKGNADRADRDAQVIQWLGRAAGNELGEGGYRRLGPDARIEGAFLRQRCRRVALLNGHRRDVPGRVETARFDTGTPDVKSYDDLGHRCPPSWSRG